MRIGQLTVTAPVMCDDDLLPADEAKLLVFALGLDPEALVRAYGERDHYTATEIDAILPAISGLHLISTDDIKHLRTWMRDMTLSHAIRIERAK